MRIFRKIGFALVVLHFSINASAQLAAGREKYLGNISSGYTYSDFMKYWNQITPENGGKWGSVEGTMNIMSWNNMDQVSNYAKTKGIPLRFHTLIWGQQQPSWIASLPSDQQLAQVEEWIRLAAARYPGVQMIDVVNEPLPSHAPAGYKNALGGDGATGWDWVIKSFELARKYFPHAELHINDYGILSSSINTKTYSEIITLLKTRGLIDGIGCQGHFLENTPASVVQTNLNTLAKLELPVYITEFDLNIADDALQLTRYKSLFPVLWEHPAVKGITLWGYRQGSIWRTDAYLLRSDGSERPAMTWLKGYFNSTGAPETAYPGIRLFPNPADDFIQINGAYGASLEIMDISGRCLYRQILDSPGEVIPIASMPRGLLLFRVTTAGEQQVFKAIKR